MIWPSGGDYRRDINAGSIETRLKKLEELKT
jgi:hypothetical protein